MKLPSTKTMNKSMALLFLILILTNVSSAQKVEHKIIGNDVEDKSMLKIRPSISFSIPPTEIVEGLPMTLNLEAQYWTKPMDYRFTGSFGTFKGASAGITYHMVNQIKTRNEKFVISRSKSGNTTTTTYFKSPVNIYRISGPCADLTSGVFGNAGFYSKLDFGWDFQTYGRSYATYENRTLKGAKNGWMSIKLQGVLANVAVDMTDYFKLGAGTGKYTEERKMAVGGQVNFSGAISPWQKITFHLNMPLGYMKYMGVYAAPETTSKGSPILSINLGLQVRL
jgi:hypothetical protein